MKEGVPPRHSTLLPRARSPASLGPCWFPSGFVRLVLCAATLLLIAAGAGAAELHGKVVGVSDGDTITVLDDLRNPHKVRLAGIDAPEKNQRYGTQAKEHLATLVFGRPVLVIWHKYDRYRRIVGQVRLAASSVCRRPDCPHVEDVGLAQIESGLAWHYKQYQNEQPVEDRRRYSLAEQAARTRREGLWKDAHPIPPWEYRSNHGAGIATGDEG
jgi:endonuclease YncB( thermonuclease family)